MNPKDICVSLETAKKLKQNGWNNISVFVYIKEYDEYCLKLLEDISYDNNSNQTDFYYAPTSSEIPLPNKFSIHIEDNKYWVTRIMPKSNDHLLDGYSGDNRLYDYEVEAKANMWLYLRDKQ